MNLTVHRRLVLKAGLAAGASLVLPSARACEFFSSTLRILHPWSRASRDGATSAIVSTKFDQVLQDDRLIHVETPVAAGAEMGGIDAASRVDFPIPAGRETALGETGTYLRLVRLRHPLEMGRAYPLHLFFDRGGLVQADFDIDYA
jgi:copper(I)-binding protein